MPGFSGIVSLTNRDKHQVVADLERMTDAVSHFPDYLKGFYYFKRNEVAFSNASLHIPGVPIQEFHDRANGIHTVVDGEVHNIKELEAETIGKNASKNSAEVLSHLYKSNNGFEFFKRVVGWFNLIIYDENKDLLLIANDRYGMRPLYYHDANGALVFSSEVKAIPRVLPRRPDLDYEGIADLFTFNGILNEKTLFKGISRLPPASLWVYRDGKWSKGTYWSWQDHSPGDELSQDEAVEAGNQLFGRIVKRYLRDSYVVSLTGGMDTRAMMSLVGQHERPAACFTYGISENTADAMIARRVAKTLGVPHEFILIDDSFLDHFSRYAERAIWISDGMGDIEVGSILHVFSGYRNSICVAGKYGNQMLRDMRSKVFEMNQAANLEVFSRDFIKEIQGYSEHSLERARQRFAGLARQTDRHLLFTLVEECRRYWGGNLALENAVTLLRTPYTDSELIEWLLKSPSTIKMDDRFQRSIVRNNHVQLARIPTDKGSYFLPGDLSTMLEALFFRAWSFLGIVSNSRRIPPKLGLDDTFFSNSVTTKYRSWYRGRLKDYVREMLLDHRTLSRGFFDPSALRRVVDRHTRREGDCSNQIRRAISFELFLRLFTD